MQKISEDDTPPASLHIAGSDAADVPGGGIEP